MNCPNSNFWPMIRYCKPWSLGSVGLMSVLGPVLHYCNTSGAPYAHPQANQDAGHCEPSTDGASGPAQSTVVHESADVKGFGCRPYEGRSRGHGGPAFESLQGRKPREWEYWQCGGRYGDLGAARPAADGGQCDAAG